MICILYVTLVSAILGIAGLLTERFLPANAQRRWIWFMAIGMSVGLPGVYRTNHTWSILSAIDSGGESSPLAGILPSSAAIMDPAWWTSERSYESLINPAWLVASALLVTWGLVNALRVSFLIYRTRRRRGAAESASMVDGVPVLVTDAMGPATVGLWRSHVLLPRWVLAMPGSQRQYVVRHEEEHRRAGDARLLLVASLALILLPWNISLWWLHRRLRLAVEMDCDNRVVGSLGNPNAYGELLFKVAQASSHSPRLQPAFLGGVGMLEYRLRRLLAPEQPRHIQRFVLPIAAAFFLMTALALPHPVLGVASDAHTHASTTETHD
jgi:beta-lactamase regulating signal transducer with metallopeptidase domain